MVFSYYISGLAQFVGVSPCDCAFFISEIMKRLILFLCPIHPSRNVWSSQDNPIDVEELPVVESFDYDEIVITGGDFLRYKYQLRYLCRGIKDMFRCMGKKVSVLIHTYRGSWSDLDVIRSDINGLVYSPRSNEGLKYFREVNNKLMKDIVVRDNYKNYLIVNEDIIDGLPENTRCWQKETVQSFNDTATQTDFRRVASFWI